MRSTLCAFYFWFVGHLCIQQFLCAQPSPERIIQALYNAREAVQSEFYEVEFKMKAFSWADTLKYVAKVHLIRQSSDTLFNGLFSLDLDTLWFGYDGHYIYRGDRKKSELLQADARQHPYLYIKGALYGHLIDEGFMKASRSLLEIIHQKLYHIEFSDTTINSSPCLGILIRLPDSEGFTDQTLFMAIDTMESVVRHRSYSVFFQENEQYQEWNFSNINLGQDSLITRMMKNELETYQKHAVYTLDTVDIEKEEEVNIILTDIKGIRLDDLSQLSLSFDTSEYIFLDFWYTSCYPCIKSIPHINKLYKELQNKNVAVYGVNPIDNLDKDAARLEKFMRNNPMSYPTIMPEEESRSRLNVPGYPTFIILDKERSIIYSATGFSETLYEEVMEFIVPLLK